MLQTLYTQVAAAALLLICGFAIVSGSWRERMCGIMYLAAYAMTIGFGMITTRDPAVYNSVSDTLLVPGFAVIARKSPHLWAKCALGIQVFSVGVDIAALIFDEINRWQFLTIQNAAGYAILACLLVGTFAARARRRAEKQARP